MKLDSLVDKYQKSIVEFGEEQELIESEQSDEEMSEAFDDYPEDVRMICADDAQQNSYK